MSCVALKRKLRDQICSQVHLSLMTPTRVLLAAAAASRSEGMTGHTADVTGAFLNASVAFDERINGPPSTQWQTRRLLD